MKKPTHLIKKPLSLHLRTVRALGADDLRTTTGGALGPSGTCVGTGSGTPDLSYITC